MIDTPISENLSQSEKLTSNYIQTYDALCYHGYQEQDCKFNKHLIQIDGKRQS